jgi:hypothetical protein
MCVVENVHGVGLCYFWTAAAFCVSASAGARTAQHALLAPPETENENIKKSVTAKALKWRNQPPAA